VLSGLFIWTKPLVASCQTLAYASAGFAHRSIYAQVVQPYWLCLGWRNSPGAPSYNKWVRFFSHRLYNALRICLGWRPCPAKPLSCYNVF